MAATIPPNFINDGCSSVAKVFERFFHWLGYDIEKHCDQHDADYCTRLNPPGSMTYAKKIMDDRRLRDGMKSDLPWYWDWSAGLFYRGLLIGGSWGSWDSCGPAAGKVCRHGQPMPEWMQALA